MTESQYSSSSTSSNKLVSGGSGGSTYQTPSYGQSSYKYGETTGLTGSGVK